jgi:hypothetical protein
LIFFVLDKIKRFLFFYCARPVASRAIQKARSIENELNTFECDDEVATINSHHSIDFRTIDTLNNIGDLYSDTQSERSDSAADAAGRASLSSVCQECACCQKFKHELAYLNKKLKLYESLYAGTPNVLQWFENLKLSYRLTNQKVKQSNLVDATTHSNNGLPLALNQDDISCNRRDKTKKITHPIPQIVIDDIL